MRPFFCDVDDQCDRADQQGTCVLAYGACAYPDPTCEEFRRRYDGSAGVLAGACVGSEDEAGGDPWCEPEICGDGYSECRETDPPCPSGDSAAGAIDLGPGAASNEVDLSAARDEFLGTCAEAGGRDAFFELTVAARELVYIDTAGSDFRAVLAVRMGRCRDEGPILGCSAFPCGEGSPEVARFAATLDPGVYCAVLDQLGYADSVVGGFHGAIRVARGPADAAVLDGAFASGETCAATDRASASCGGAGGNDAVYAVLACPAALDIGADTCPLQGGFAPIVSLREGDFAGGAELACGPGCVSDAGVGATASGPGIVWVTVDGADAASCGAFELHLSR